MHHYTRLIAEAFAHLSHLTYPEIILAILASGHPLPVPEGVIFFALGILARHGIHMLAGVIAVAALSCFIYDMALYSLAYAGSKLVDALSKRAMSWHHWYTGKRDHEVFFLTFVSHFVPGWRMANPVIAAGLGVPPKRFLLYTLVPALVYPAIYVLAGYFLARF